MILNPGVESMRRRWQQAFTLVELVVVMAFIGFLTAIIIPRFIEMNERVKLAELQTIIAAVETGSAANYAAHVRNTGNSMPVRVNDNCEEIAIQAALPNGLPENFTVISETVSAKPGEHIGTCTITHNITGHVKDARILLTETEAD